MDGEFLLYIIRRFLQCKVQAYKIGGYIMFLLSRNIEVCVIDFSCNKMFTVLDRFDMFFAVWCKYFF